MQEVINETIDNNLDFSFDSSDDESYKNVFQNLLKLIFEKLDKNKIGICSKSSTSYTRITVGQALKDERNKRVNDKRFNCYYCNTNCT